MTSDPAFDFQESQISRQETRRIPQGFQIGLPIGQNATKGQVNAMLDQQHPGYRTQELRPDCWAKICEQDNQASIAKIMALQDLPDDFGDSRWPM